MEEKENEFLKALGIPLTIAAYLTFCGGLKLYGYYSVFDIDISSRMSIASLPFASIPNLYSLCLIILLVLLTSISLKFFISRLDKERGGDGDFVGASLTIGTKFLIISIMSLAMLLMLVFVKDPRTIWGYVTMPVTMYFSLMISFKSTSFLTPYISNKVDRITVLMGLIGFPISVLVTSKLVAYDVLDNKLYDKIEKITLKSSSDSVDFIGAKLLGKEDGDYIVLSKDNQHVYYLQSDDVIFIKVFSNKVK